MEGSFIFLSESRDSFGRYNFKVKYNGQGKFNGSYFNNCLKPKILKERRNWNFSKIEQEIFSDKDLALFRINLANLGIKEIYNDYCYEEIGDLYDDSCIIGRRVYIGCYDKSITLT